MHEALEQRAKEDNVSKSMIVEEALAHYLGIELDNPLYKTRKEVLNKLKEFEKRLAELEQRIEKLEKQRQGLVRFK